MKNHLKLTILSIALLILTQTASALTKDETLKNLKNTHKATFVTPSNAGQGRIDLFKSKLNFKDWNSGIKSVEAFVLENAEGEKKLIAQMNEIIKQNNELTNIIQLAYNSLFGPNGNIQVNVVNSSLKKLKDIQRAMEESQKKLKGTILFLQRKKDAREVLLEFAELVFNTARQTHVNIDEKTGFQYGKIG